MPRVFDSIDALRPLVGQEIAVSDWLLVPQELIDAFAALTGDRQWIHVDPERARRESPYRATVAHGFLTLSLVSRCLVEAVHINGIQRLINYGFNRLRFPGPVRAGNRLRARIALQAFEEVPGGVQLTWLVTVEVENEPKPALVAEWLVRYYR
jgi:acyl dehydratase